MVQNGIGPIDGLLEACKAGKLKPKTIMNTLENITKNISNIKKTNMEIIPVDLLGSNDNYVGFSNTDSSHNKQILQLRKYVKLYLEISTIIMGNQFHSNNELSENEIFMKCVNSNKVKLRMYTIQLLFKWLKSDILIREYRNLKDKGNFKNVVNYPVSLSNYIIRCVLTSSMQKAELDRLKIDDKMKLQSDTFALESMLVDEYINKYKDLRCFFFKHMHNLIIKCASEKINGLSNIDEKIKKNGDILNSITTISLRIYYILMRSSVPKIDESQDEEIVQRDSLFVPCIFEDEKYVEKIKKLDKEYRVIYQKLWLSYIRLILNKGDCISQIVPIQILKNTLEYVSETVVSVISNPLELADIFRSCYDGIYNSEDKINDIDRLSLSIISLSGLFFLITKNRLSESSFLENNNENISTGYYRRLYDIITPPVFLLKTRGRFFSLISISLMSPMIPLTVLCCFIKKLVRISIFTATSDTIWIISLVNTLISKHRNALFPILSLDENSNEYDFVLSILNQEDGELWSYSSDINSYIVKNTELLDNSKYDEKSSNADLSNVNPAKNMGTYISANFGLWELYLLNKSVVPVIRNVSKTLVLNASNAAVNYHMHDLNNEELVGLSSEDVLNHEISSQNGIINTCTSVFKKNKRECKDSNSIIPHNYMEDNDPSSFSINKSSAKFFTNSDVDLLALI